MLCFVDFLKKLRRYQTLFCFVAAASLLGLVYESWNTQYLTLLLGLAGAFETWLDSRLKRNSSPKDENSLNA